MIEVIINTRHIVGALLDMKNTFTSAELDQINNALKERYNSVAYHTARTFKIGDQVHFSTRAGLVVNGVIRKINAKTVQVYSSTTNVNWKVSPGLLLLTQG